MPPQPEPVLTEHVFNQPPARSELYEERQRTRSTVAEAAAIAVRKEMALIHALDRPVPQTPEPIWKESSLLSDVPQTNTKHSPYAA